MTARQSTAGEMAPQRVVAAVIVRDGRYLVCQRPAHKRHGGLWEFPGGKCEPGESDHDAMVREMAEELGVTVTEVGAPLRTVGDPGAPFLIVFLPTVIAGEPSALEHDALQWGAPQELLALPLAPGDRLVMEWLGAVASGLDASAR